MAKAPFTNSLVNETSPYLLQHAHNPVDWHAWNDLTLAKARSNDKMLLISIGYSACHWCHVMEKESFENEEVAEIMNRNFICIKVDREERPDVDQVYMNAVQLITGSGGWPLNCFALPDGKPFFGGTYFRKEQWMQLLENISTLFVKRRKELEEQAESLTNGVKAADLIQPGRSDEPFAPAELAEAVTRMEKQFDYQEGGMGYAPKFPMPATQVFLLRYSHFTGDENISEFVRLTLRKMAYGGIYDQLGGGFARYSVDAQWKVPHFEKMLYDNAQLVSLYTEAYRAFRDNLFKEVAEETLQFILRELTSPSTGFYSALDADSEGTEGRFYTWKIAEINQILGKQADLVSKYYSVGGKGAWESGQNILLRSRSVEEFAREQGLQPSAFKNLLKPARAKLLKVRSIRIRPGLDNKIIVSWNALMMKGFIDAYQAFSKPVYLETAIKNAGYLLEKAIRTDGGLFHEALSKKNPINGFLDDYASLVDALLGLYQATFDENWLRKALQLSEYAIRHFFDGTSGFFFYTSDLDPALISRKTELNDNVIPSSNSLMARNLFILGLAYEREDFTQMSENMVSKIRAQMVKYLSAHANWASCMISLAYPFYTLAVTGPQCLEKAAELRKSYHPSVFICGSKTESELPVLKGRYIEGQTMIWVCSGKTCKLPTKSVEEAIKYFSR